MGYTYGRRRALLKRMQCGFTMVEVIVAIGMLTLVGLAAAQFAITAVHSSYAHQQRAIAVGLAESGMEQVQESVKGKDGNTIFSTLTSGMSKSGAQEALKAATDLNVIENASDTIDVGWTDSPSATAIQAKVETNDRQGKGTTYTVYTVVGKCYRLSTQASCLSASKQGLVTSSGAVGAYKYVGKGNKAVDAASITDATKFPTGPFNTGTASSPTYSPMVRVVVLVTWPDSQHQGKTCWYSTATIFDGSNDDTLKSK